MPGGTVHSLISVANTLKTKGFMTLVTSSVTVAPFCGVHSCLYIPPGTFGTCNNRLTACVCMQLAGIALYPTRGLT